jgi:hypothetical protein
LLDPTADSAIRALLWVWIVPNAVLLAANLFPIPTSDAPQLWLAFQQVLATRDQEAARTAAHAARRSLEESDAAFAHSDMDAEKLADDILARVRKDDTRP